MQRSQSSGFDVLDLGRRAGDPGVVDQNVEATQLAPHVGEEPLDVGKKRDVGDALRHRGQSAPRLGERGPVDVADVNTRAVLDEGLRDRPADPGGTRGHQHAQTLCGHVHSHLPVVPPPAVASRAARRGSVARSAPLESALDERLARNRNRDRMAVARREGGRRRSPALAARGHRHGELVLPRSTGCSRGAGIRRRRSRRHRLRRGPGLVHRPAHRLRRRAGARRRARPAGDRHRHAGSDRREPGAPRVVACLDARMGEVYYAASNTARGRARSDSPGLRRPGAVAPPEGNDWIGCAPASRWVARRSWAGTAPGLDGVVSRSIPRGGGDSAARGAATRGGRGRRPGGGGARYLRDNVALKRSER